MVRGLSPYPAAWTTLNDKICKIYKTEVRDSNSPNLHPGDFWTDGKTLLTFQCGEGVIDIIELQLEGKKRMKIDDFLRGNKLE
jgi:methionyl-tRNA formyltransferase